MGSVGEQWEISDAIGMSIGTATFAVALLWINNIKESER